MNTNKLMTPYFESWWNGPDGGDQSMEDEHQTFWLEFLNEIGLTRSNLSEIKILDFGCNQGGMLRLLHDISPIKEGLGVDLAIKAIEVANSRKGDRPLDYKLAGELVEISNYFDLALSSSVLYLVEDLEWHAKEIYGVLKKGATYIANHPDYRSYPNGETVQQLINQHASCPSKNHSLDAIAQAFASAGFKVEIKRRLPTGFVSYSAGSLWYNSVGELLEQAYQHAYIFKFTKPNS
jgi:SAM-dependent methyltransferase